MRCSLHPPHPSGPGSLRTVKKCEPIVSRRTKVPPRWSEWKASAAERSPPRRLSSDTLPLRKFAQWPHRPTPHTLLGAGGRRLRAPQAQRLLPQEPRRVTCGVLLCAGPPAPFPLCERLIIRRPLRDHHHDAASLTAALQAFMVSAFAMSRVMRLSLIPPREARRSMEAALLDLASIVLRGLSSVPSEGEGSGAPRGAI